MAMGDGDGRRRETGRDGMEMEGRSKHGTQTENAE